MITSKAFELPSPLEYLCLESLLVGEERNGEYRERGYAVITREFPNRNTVRCITTALPIPIDILHVNDPALRIAPICRALPVLEHTAGGFDSVHRGNNQQTWREYLPDVREIDLARLSSLGK